MTNTVAVALINSFALVLIVTGLTVALGHRVSALAALAGNGMALSGWTLFFVLDIARRSWWAALPLVLVLLTAQRIRKTEGLR